MKIRLGFVSNSSSSNFIVNGYSYFSLFDLAKAMIQIRTNDSETWTDVETSSINKAIEEDRDPNTSIYFATCNYDTYIKEVFGHYIVISSNNHPFRDNLSGIIAPPMHLHEWLDQRGYIHEDCGTWPFTEAIDTWKLQCEEIFWSPKYDLEISRYDYMEAHRKGDKDAKGYCSDKGHFCDMMVLASTKEVICPFCYNKKQEKKQPRINSRFDILDIRKKDLKSD